MSITEFLIYYFPVALSWILFIVILVIIYELFKWLFEMFIEFIYWVVSKIT